MTGELSLLLTYQGCEMLSNVPAVWFTKASTETPPFSSLFCHDDIQLKTFTGHQFLHSRVQYGVKKQFPSSCLPQLLPLRQTITCNSVSQYSLFFPASLALATGSPSQGYPMGEENYSWGVTSYLRRCSSISRRQWGRSSCCSSCPTISWGGGADAQRSLFSCSAPRSASFLWYGYAFPSRFTCGLTK